MKITVKYLSFLYLFFLVLFAQSANAQYMDPGFRKEWLEIDTLILTKDLTRTALEKVFQLQMLAKEKSLPAQSLKCLIYRYTLESRITDDNPNLSITILGNEIDTTTDAIIKAVLYSLLAKQYQVYFNNHRWSLYGRINTVNFSKTDMATWSHDDFAHAISSSFLLSLQNRELLINTDISKYEAVVIAGNSRKLRPSLFDLLAHEALDYFKSGDYYLTRPTYAFIVKDTLALGLSGKFMSAKFQTQDSTSLQWWSLNLFQQLMRTHSNDPDKSAFLEVNLERLQWVYSVGTFDNKDQFYRTALEEITANYSQYPTVSQAWYLLARMEADNAASYQPFGDTSNRYSYVLALQWIEKGLLLHKEKANGTSSLLNLKIEITRKQLGTHTEIVNIPNKPFRALVNFRNVDTLYGRIVRIDNADELLDNQVGFDFWKKILQKNVYRTFKQPLPKTGDFQTHSTEIRIDGLPVGEYALIGSSGAAFNDTLQKLSFQSFHISRISYIKNRNDFFVLDRVDGQPLKDVQVTIFQQSYDREQKKYISKKTAERVSDKNGYFSINEKKEPANYSYAFKFGKDKLMLRENDYLYYENEQPVGEIIEKDQHFTKSNSRIFFFTDRSIYRPGQLVQYKGIAVTKQMKTLENKLLLTKDSILVLLVDAKNKKLDSARVSLNEFGSFSGQFNLPKNLLTGNFSIQTPAYGQSTSYFSVEEYKRPTFQVTLDKAKGSYRLNDTVTITGYANAYAGNHLDGASVKYTVRRNARFMHPWFSKRPGPNSQEREIAQGEMETDNNGKFNIVFNALADDLIAKSENPLFDFTINVDVTDISGETRSNSIQVTVGVTSLLLTIIAPPVSDVDSLKVIKINTTNLSLEKEPAIVSLRIYSLSAPENPIRKRYWNRPDEFVMDQKDFTGYFPNDEYEEESNYLTWPIGSVIVKGNIDTKSTDTFSIPENLLKPGFYKIDATTIDKYGVEVKEVGYTQLFSNNGTGLPVPGYQFIHTINATAKPGETARFLSGSSVDKLFIIRKTEKPGKSNAGYQFSQRNKGLESIVYQPLESDRGGVSLTEAYVYNNRIYTNQFNVIIPWNNKELTIKYTSFRDKTEPGSKEKWTMEVKTDKNEKAPAELLTSMYDASLDQFKTHDWKAPNIWVKNYSQTLFSGASNFRMQFSRENDVPEIYPEWKEIIFDRLAHTGSELWEQDLNNWSKDSSFAMASVINKIRERIDFSTQRESYLSESTRRNNSGMLIRGTNSLIQDKLANGINEPVIERYDKVYSGPPPSPYKKPQADISQTVIRKNFSETAFFFPQLIADSTGKYSISFTMPDALTKWKWMSLAHTKDLAFGTYNAEIITQKKLMVQANAPRFLREGDNMEFSGKVVNLSDKEITGQARLELIDATTGSSVDGWFQNVFPTQYFTVEAGQSSALKFPIQIPFSFNRPLTWRLTGFAGEYSDGEENMLPVLTNRILVTESLPIFLPDDSTRKFTFDKLVNTTSETRTNESLTLEYTSNPVWYAVQALPYLMEYPYECSEQSFNRLFANLLSAHILNKYPKIKQIFAQWKADTSSLKSNLQKNEELKQVLLEETPWILQASNQEERQKNISKLFDLASQYSQTESLVEKLQQLQLPDGSFSWFKGGYSDRYITQYILTGFGKLKRLGAITPDINLRLKSILVNALNYADTQLKDDYDRLLKNKADLNKEQLSPIQMDYLYMRSFFNDIANSSPNVHQFFLSQGKKFWVKQNSYYKALLGMVLYRNKEEKTASNDILPALLENAVRNSQQGMYWKTSYTRSWFQSPIEHQSMLISFMSEIALHNPNNTLLKNIDAMKTWLLLNKQTTDWGTTLATADACYALLANGTDWLNSNKTVTIKLGDVSINSGEEKKQAGTGYFKKRIEGDLVKPEMGKITIESHTNNSYTTKPVASAPSWGSVYWQYFEDLDKITPAATPLSVKKNIFLEKNTAKGKLLEPINESDVLHTGDKVIIRMELRSDRDMDYLHLKDMRAAAMEPTNVLSGYRWQDGLGYYESTRDASSNFFISHLSKGTYVFEYPVFITHTGIFSVGIASIQSMYAPEFTSHSEGIKIRVEGK